MENVHNNYHYHTDMLTKFGQNHIQLFKRPHVRCTSMFTYKIDNKCIDRVYSSKLF